MDPSGDRFDTVYSLWPFKATYLICSQQFSEKWLFKVVRFVRLLQIQSGKINRLEIGKIRSWYNRQSVEDTVLLIHIY